MITNDALIDFVKTRSWYQTIDFGDGVISKGCDWCGDPAWSNIVKFLPDSLEGKSVLDLGCNAGLFCVRSALMGAKKVVGIDYTGWRPNWDFEEQQVFVRNYFEQKHTTYLPITYLSGKMEEVLKKFVPEWFDYVYGIASLYYTEDPDGTVESISKITNNAIIRLRDENRIKLFTGLFEKYGFKQEAVLQEKWWEVLGRNTDDFYLYLYTKG